MQVRTGTGWSCERGEDACKKFIIRSNLVEKALLRAYEELNVKAVARKLENPKLKKAAEVMLAFKEKSGFVG